MSNWADLPKEILHLILSNVFAGKDRHTFSRVCQSWNAVTLDLLYHCSPILVLCKRSSHRPWKFFQYNGFYSMKFPQVLHGAHIRCAKYGWLLLCRDDHSLFFFNPFNERQMMIHHIPKCDYPYSRICFFNEPTSPSCILVGVMNTHIRDRHVRIGVLNLGDDKWESYLCPIEAVSSCLSVCSPILHGGFLYCLDRKGNLHMNELGNPLSWMIVNTIRPLPANTPRHEYEEQYLIKLEEEQDLLLAVLVAYDERKVNVYKLDMMNESKPKEWQPVEDLSDRALFVSYNTSFVVTAPPPPLEWMANKIFFPKLHKHLGDYNGVFYCLNTKKYHSYGGEYSSKIPIGLRGIDWATWIVPEPTPTFSYK